MRQIEGGAHQCQKETTRSRVTDLELVNINPRNAPMVAKRPTVSG